MRKKEERKMSIITILIVTIVLIISVVCIVINLRENKADSNFVHINKNTEYVLSKKISGYGECKLKVIIPRGYKYINQDILSIGYLTIYTEDNMTNVSMQLKTDNVEKIVNEDIKIKYNNAIEGNNTIKEYNINESEGYSIVTYAVKSKVENNQDVTIYTTYLVKQLDDNIVYVCLIESKNTEISEKDALKLIKIEYLGVEQ